MTYLEAGVPVRTSRARAATAHAACGADSVSWLTNPRWNAFPKPQIALRRGWGAPGTDMHVSTFHKMIASFAEVFHHTSGVEVPLTEQETDGEEVLDLQLFHRVEGCPPVPVLGEQLVWPSYVDDGAVCDTATWVSQQGMVRHWHLNDSGEFAMQAALPLASSASTEGDSGNAVARKIRALMCPETTAQTQGLHAPAILTIFAPKGGYDWVLHDDEANMRGEVVALDLFQTPDEALPFEASLLPVLVVAVLESGGAPILIPPNLAQTSIALRDCVVVEQRRVSNLWLDDVSYFLHRCARWQTTPIIYAYLQQDLQDDGFVAGQVIPHLIRVFEEHGEGTAYHAAVRRRAVLSLHALAVHDEQYGLAESSRASLLRLLHGGNPAMQAVLEAAPYRTSPAAGATAEAPSTVEAWLGMYWNMSWCWPKAGCVLRVPAVVYPFGAALKPLQQKAQYVPVVYPPGSCSPVYGTERDSIAETVEQYFEMKELEAKPRELLAYLRTRKSAADDLDELF